MALDNNLERLTKNREWLSEVSKSEPNSKFTEAYATREMLQSFISAAQTEINCLNDKILEGRLDYAEFAYANFLSLLNSKCEFFEERYGLYGKKKETQNAKD